MFGFMEWAGAFGESNADVEAKRLFFELREKLDKQGFVFSLPMSIIECNYIERLKWLKQRASEWGLED